MICLSSLFSIKINVSLRKNNKTLSSRIDNKMGSNAIADMYQHSPNLFFDHMTTIIRQSLIHGMIHPSLLLCTLIPLVNDTMGDTTQSNNFRAIAGGRMI